jgi:single-stranded DNA-specific DHH superfamily exonuclease
MAVQQAENVARLAGKMPTGAARSLEASKAANLDWRELLRRAWSETIPSDYSWTRPNRRHIWNGLYLPGVTSEGIGVVAIAVDCSGSIEFCGAGLAAMFVIGMAMRTSWTESAIEKLIEGASLYAAVASIADCVPLLGKTRVITKLGLAALAQTRHCGMRELLKASGADPLVPDSEDVAFGIAPRINAAGRVDHPAAALAVVEAASDPAGARAAVAHLDRLNLFRRELVRDHLHQLCGAMAEEIPAVILFREQTPKGIAGLLASKCVERFGGTG